MIGVSGYILTVVASLSVLVMAALLGLLVWRRLVLTQRRANKAEIRAAAAEACLAAAPVGCYAFAHLDGAARCSAELSRMLDLEAGTVDFDALLERLEKTDAEALQQAATGLVEDGTHFHMTVARRDQSHMFEVIGTRARAATGGISTALLWFSDSTEQTQALAAAQAERDATAALLDQVPLPLWRRDTNLDLVYCNLAYAQAVDRTREEVLAKGTELAGQKMTEVSRAMARRAQQSGATERESHHVVVSGERRLLELAEQVIPGGSAGWALDLTAQADLKDQLTRHASAHAEVLENLATAIAIYGSDLHLKFFNSAYARLWGLDEDRLTGEPHLSDVLELQRERRRLPEQSDFPAYKRERQKLYSTLIAPMEELQHLPDGTTLRMTVAPHPFGGVLFTFEDVTDRLALESSYNTLIAVQRETLNNLYEGVAVYGADGRLKLHNAAFARIWRLPGELLQAEPHARDVVLLTRRFFGVSDEEWPRLMENMVVQSTEPSANNGRLERADQSVVDWAQVPLPDGASLFTYLDVTDSIRVERALRERTEALETTDRLKSEFLANISYELRTPLNAIVGFAEILEHKYFGELNERQLEYARAIVESSQRLLTLINDILDLATIEAGYLQLDLAPVDLTALLETIHTLSHERARSRGVELEIHCPDEIPPLVADERRLKQALFNLLSNSLKFTPSGGRVTVSVEQQEDDVLLAVADTGIGIPPEQHSKVFDKFERGSGQGRQAGAGLGLSLVKSLIELHHGRIELRSTPNSGTSVICYLPKRPPEGELEAPAETIEHQELPPPDEAAAQA